jgi:hypothetical protein
MEERLAGVSQGAQRELRVWRKTHVWQIRPAILISSFILAGWLSLSSVFAADSKKQPDADEQSGSRYSFGGSQADIIAFINAQIAKGWEEAGIAPSPKATDAEWCRRIYLDIVGRVPKVYELRQFLASTPTNRKEKLLDKLLDSDDYVQEYARNWTTHWTNLLIGRPPARRNRRDMTNRDGMQQYLRQGFLRNKPYDQMVYELVSATGNTKPGSEKYNGAANFLVGKLQENATEATARTAKYFLGLQVQCTQCHNHPFNDWKQDQFWSLNAFFRQTTARASRNGREIDTTLLSNQDFSGEGVSKTPKEAEIYYELRNGQMQVAYPKFVDGTTINPSGYVKDVDRRAELGRLIIKSEYLGKAIVNRYWGHFLGYGFTKPVDDLGPHNAPSHPELLERLGKEFASHDHDLKQLIRWITLSDAYGLSSKVTTGQKTNAKDDPTLGEKPKFSHFYLRQMQAEELYESMMAIMYEHKKAGDYAENENKKADILRQFNITFGNDEGEEATTFNGTIPQALMMMNGEMIKMATNVKPDGFLYKLVTSSRGHDALDILFEATLARRPNGMDSSMANALLGTRRDVLGGYQDVLWALLNSNEFIFVH